MYQVRLPIHTYHDVDVMGAMPIKQHLYHVNPTKVTISEEGSGVHVG